LEQIRNRYRHFQDHFGRQTETLQNSPAFRDVAQRFYADGFKDWHILSAAFNLRLNWEMRRLGIDVSDGMRQAAIVKTVSEIVEFSVESPDRIAGALEELTHMFEISDATCLNTYGFELRRPDVRPEVVRRFLRKRMRHYDLDLSHEPLFADGGGTWPSV
jgi:hypothetical protein